MAFDDAGAAVQGQPGEDRTVVLGQTVLNVHGGQGAGTPQRPARAFDPERYRLVRFDQRNCGRSTPHASDPAADMSRNTAQHLIDDMEQLREHLPSPRPGTGSATASRRTNGTATCSPPTRG